MSGVGKVESVWRFPVKSMAGESLERVFLGFSGVYGDRFYAFRSGGFEAFRLEAFPYLTAREQSRMLRFRARYRSDEALAPPNLAAAEGIAPGVTPIYGDAEQLRVEVETPSAEVLALDDPRLAEMLGEGIGEEHVLSLVRSERALTDCRPISLISLQTIRGIEDEVGVPVDPLRFRANLYLDLSGDGDATEEDWIGRSLRIGEKATVAVLERDPRCKMITLDPETGESNPAILREVAQARGGMAGLYGAVLVEGMVHAGDEVHLL